MSLDVEESDALKRLQKIHDTTMAAKRGPVPVMRYILQSYILPYLPMFQCREMVRDSLGTHTVVSRRQARRQLFVVCDAES